MIDPLRTGLSGLFAAQKRLDASAQNIANAGSTAGVEGGQLVNKPYTPVTPVQKSLDQGGVEAKLLPKVNKTVPVFDPDDPLANAEGIVEYPNVNMEEEVAGTLIAKNAFQANLQTIKKSQEMFDSLMKSMDA